MTISLGDGDHDRRSNGEENGLENTTKDEERPTTESVGEEGGGEGEQNAKGIIKSVDQGNGGIISENFGIHFGRVLGHHGLTSDLLTKVDDKADKETTANGFFAKQVAK